MRWNNKLKQYLTLPPQIQSFEEYILNQLYFNKEGNEASWLIYLIKDFLPRE
jgi:hypothetical protein